MDGESVAVPALLRLPSYCPPQPYSRDIAVSRPLSDAVTQTEHRLFTRTSEQSLALVNVLFREYRARYTVTFSKRWTITLFKTLPVTVCSNIDSFLCWPWLEDMEEHSSLGEKVVCSMCEGGGAVRFLQRLDHYVGAIGSSRWTGRKVLAWEVAEEDDHRTMARVSFLGTWGQTFSMQNTLVWLG